MASLRALLTVCLIVVCVGAVGAQKIKYTKCENVTQTATIDEVDVMPCPAIPCKFKKGTNVSFTLTFTMGSKIATNVTTVVHGIIGGLSLPFDTPFTNACATTGIHCPLNPGDKVVYKAKLLIEEAYPQVVLYAKWELRDQANMDIVCFEVPAQIV